MPSPSYEPNELIITVEAGAPLADVLSLIDSKNQQFAFEPMDTAPLLGTAGSGTIGGMIGTGLAGPRRIKAGGARDHLLGAHAVSGFGDSFKTGGKVVKNVTGYDLCKLLAGSLGTLAVMTEVTLKVMPRPESERTLVLRSLDDLTANRAMTAALGSPFDVSAAAHLPPSALRPSVGGLDRLGIALMARSRWCGSRASWPRPPIGPASLARTLAPFGAADTLEDADVGRGLAFDPRRASPLRRGERSAAGRSGGSSARRLRAARWGRRSRAKPGARSSMTGAAG